MVVERLEEILPFSGYEMQLSPGEDEALLGNLCVRITARSGIVAVTASG
jgi:hypothetical protein